MMGSFFWLKQQIIFLSGWVRTPVKTEWVNKMRWQIVLFFSIVCGLLLSLSQFSFIGLFQRTIPVGFSPLNTLTAVHFPKHTVNLSIYIPTLLQVFFYRGELHILPCPTKSSLVGVSRDVVPTVAQALALLSTHPEACTASPKICSALKKRLEGWESVFIC